MKDLVAIKVKIGKKGNGHAKYPDFNQLQIVKDSDMDWGKYVDVYGLGWKYDNKCGHQEEDAESPFGVWLGMLIIPEEFAKQAAEMFPNEVDLLDDTDAEAFYNQRHSLEFPDEEIDNEILTSIKLKQDLGLPLTTQQQKAIDPNDDARGIRKNKRKLWSDFRALKGVNVIDARSKYGGP